MRIALLILLTAVTVLDFLSAQSVLKVYASSQQNGNVASMAADHRDGTRWESEYSDEQWWMVEFPSSIKFSQLDLIWESARAEEYKILGSLDGQNWSRLRSVKGKKGNVDQFQFNPQPHLKYLKLDFHKRSTTYGYSIFEVLIDGKALAEDPTLAGRRLNQGADYLNPSLSPEVRVRDLVSKMNLKEKMSYLGGTGFIPDYKIGETQPLYRLGLPPFKMTDASLGAKLTKGATLFPSMVALSASFHPELAKAFGKSVAEQCRAGGYRILLGPGVNLYRVPNCGRNFEYFGEDPYLTTEMSVPYIQGVQNSGVMATVKHFVANNSEYLRKNSNSVVDERALREIYYPPFKAAIERANVKAVMMSYNLVNGQWAGQHKDLIQGVLRDEWGFKGLVMTDWWGIYDTSEALFSGLDLEMPAGEVLSPDRVQALLDKEVIDEKFLDLRLSHILTPICEFGLFDAQDAEEVLRSNWVEHRKVAEQVAREGLVLLKNEGQVLPIENNKSRIYLVGEAAKNTPPSGGGAAGFDPGSDFKNYVDAIMPFAQTMGMTVAYSPSVPKDVDKNSIGIVFVSMLEHEYMDRPFELPESDMTMIQQASKPFKKTIVVTCVGSGMEMASWVNQVDAIIYAWHPGTYGSIALAEVLFGLSNPSGKLPFSIEKRPEDAHYHGRYLPEGAKLERSFQGWDVPKGQFDIPYEEGIFTGYRWYDSQNIEPLFPFGHGLSYTSFKIGAASANIVHSGNDSNIDIQTAISNVGIRKGAQVLQVYLHDPESSEPRPVKELKAFSRIELNAGEQQTIKLSIPLKDFSFWSSQKRQWTLEKGELEVWLGFSSRDIRKKILFFFE